MIVSITYSVASSFHGSYSFCIEIDESDLTAIMRFQFFPFGEYFCSDISNELPCDGDKLGSVSEVNDSIAAKKILDIIQGIRIGPSPEFVIGLDCTKYTLHFDSGFNEATYVWWVTLPSQWLELQPLVQYLEELITASRPDPDK